MRGRGGIRGGKACWREIWEWGSIRKYQGSRESERPFSILYIADILIVPCLHIMHRKICTYPLIFDFRLAVYAPAAVLPVTVGTELGGMKPICRVSLTC